MKNFFVILGGMGTKATESFVHLLNEKTPAKKDQDYLDYLLVNHATVPDRTAYLLGESEENPAITLIEDIKQFSLMSPDFFVLTCNTAHRFFDELQEATTVPILHMPRIAVDQVIEKKAVNVGVLATSGTIKTGVYKDALARYPQLSVITPDEHLQKEVMNLIYRDIKEKNFMNKALFYQILDKMKNDYQCDTIILGCTELSLIAEYTDLSNYEVVDAQLELVNQTIKQAMKHK
ncbi:aspartate/glutamate racemase family protein [Vagococcus xieshaowenii]|uniref:Amino acid racemase n=1 Tax=Vagococcus xieshaowenii TaxID=2562451 RepID=A0AAJ5EDP2_9ENTE|nr:amino acid racemase [Vagococcus xieshaowenii]QCA28696.1 amino acid racemase [Vagococcus xieshaowenii]TFZ40496.1 amino acid racemase [Vagococcus xieshaowenii]